MKRTALFILALVAIAVLVAPQANAQKMQFNPNDNQFFYYYPLASVKQYAASQTDTLPQPTTAGVAVTMKAGGAGFITLTGWVTDSVAVGILVDSRIVGGATWTNILSDSLTSTSTGNYKEWVLRNASTEVVLGLDVEFRVRAIFRSWMCGNGGKPTTKKYNLNLNWKP